MSDPRVTYPPCDTCRREAGAVIVQIVGERRLDFCSPDCARLHMTRRLTPDERAAAMKGGEAAGAYLERIGKTDLARMTQEEWAEFCGTLYTHACADLRRRADDCVPF